MRCNSHQRDPARSHERVRFRAGLELAQPDVGRIEQCQVAGERFGRLPASDSRGIVFGLATTTSSAKPPSVTNTRPSAVGRFETMRVPAARWKGAAAFTG